MKAAFHATRGGPGEGLVLALAIWFSGAAPAGAGVWTSGGPSGNQTVQALVVDPTSPGTVYAATQAAAVFKSTDAGGSWAQASAGLTRQDVLALAVDPTNPAHLYAGAHRAVFESTDAGGSWAVAGLSEWVVSALAVDPVTPAAVYAGCTMSNPMGFWGGIYKSTDAGGTWVNALSGPAVASLAIDPAEPATVYAGTWGYGYRGTIYKSTDSGGSWALANGGLPAANINALAIDPAQHATLYAATGGRGVFKSTDAGGSWAAAGTALADRSAQDLAVDPGHHATLYAGIYGGGVYKSSDSGGSWAQVNTGLPNTNAMALALDPAGPTTLYVGLVRGSVWQSSPPPPTFFKGDFNADRAPDLVLRGASDGTRHRLWLMDGVMRLTEVDIVPDAPGAEWQVRGVDDFDADGRSDLLFWNSTSGQVEFWLMNGAVRSGPAVPLTGGATLWTSWSPSATADFNADGWPDIVWRNAASQWIVIWAMNGTARVGDLVPDPGQASDGNWSIVAAQDYDDDGSPDFLWHNSTSGRIVIWYMDASVVRVGGQFTTPAAAGHGNWKVVASADYSRLAGPGTPPIWSPDIVWRNQTSGSQVVWHMDFAGARVHGEFTQPSANTPALDWTIVGPR